MRKFFILATFITTAAAAQTVANYMSKGAEHYLQLNFELAEVQFRQAVEKDPRNMEARYNLGNALMQQKKYKAALEMFESIGAVDNKALQGAAFYNAGVSYTRQKDLPASIEAYKNALRINPTDKEARENLQKALQELKKEKKQSGGGGGGMSQNEAEKKLKQLQQKEKELQQKMQKGNGTGQGGSKDW